jgi:hypothetical protein
VLANYKVALRLPLSKLKNNVPIQAKLIGQSISSKLPFRQEKEEILLLA